MRTAGARAGCCLRRRERERAGGADSDRRGASRAEATGRDLQATSTLARPRSSRERDSPQPSRATGGANGVRLTRAPACRRRITRPREWPSSPPRIAPTRRACAPRRRAGRMLFAPEGARAGGRSRLRSARGIEGGGDGQRLTGNIDARETAVQSRARFAQPSRATGGANGVRLSRAPARLAPTRVAYSSRVHCVSLSQDQKAREHAMRAASEICPARSSDRRSERHPARAPAVMRPRVTGLAFDRLLQRLHVIDPRGDQWLHRALGRRVGFRPLREVGAIGGERRGLRRAQVAIVGAEDRRQQRSGIVGLVSRYGASTATASADRPPST